MRTTISLSGLNILLMTSALALVGCGGGGGGGGPSTEDGGVFQQSVTLDEENVEDVAASLNGVVVRSIEDAGNPFAWASVEENEQVTRFDARHFALEQVRRLPRPGQLSTAASETLQCEGGGTETWTETGTTFQIKFNNCGDGEGAVYNGTFTIKLNSESEPSPNVYTVSVTVEFNNFRVSYHSDQPDDAINGVIRMTLINDDNISEMTVSQKGWLIYRTGDYFWGLKDMNIESMENFGGAYELDIHSLKIGDTALGGYFTIQTTETVKGSGCPTSGIVQATGGGNTVTVHYGIPINVYVNGNFYDSYDSCAAL